MAKEPPGLDHEPDERSLLGFGSLMPEDEKQPGLVGRIVRLPVKLVALPFKAVGAVLRLPTKLFGRRSKPKN